MLRCLRAGQFLPRLRESPLFASAVFVAAPAARTQNERRTSTHRREQIGIAKKQFESRQ